MIKSIKDARLTDGIPSVLAKQDWVQALAGALGEIHKKTLEYAYESQIYTAIDTAPENVLDMLALQMNTQYYDETLDIDTKRKLIKGTLKWYMHAGTPSAVKELVTAVFGEGEVVEWFDYGDDPYYFKIVTNAPLTPETDAELAAMIERVKNTRSHLRMVEIHRTVELYELPGILPHPMYHPPVVKENLKLDRTAELTEYNIPFASQVIKPPIIAEAYGKDDTVSGTVNPDQG